MSIATYSCEWTALFAYLIFSCCKRIRKLVTFVVNIITFCCYIALFTYYCIILNKLFNIDNEFISYASKNDCSDYVL